MRTKFSKARIARGDHRRFRRGHGPDLHRPSAPELDGLPLMERPQAAGDRAEGHLPRRRCQGCRGNHLKDVWSTFPGLQAIKQYWG